MTRFSVNDRVLVPGVVERMGGRVPVPGAADEGDNLLAGVRLPNGDRVWFGARDLRPDTGGRDLTAQDVRDAFEMHDGLFECLECDALVREEGKWSHVRFHDRVLDLESRIRALEGSG